MLRKSHASIILVVLLLFTSSGNASMYNAETEDIETNGIEGFELTSNQISPTMNLTFLNPDTYEPRNQFSSLLYSIYSELGITNEHSTGDFSFVGSRTFAYPADPSTGDGIPSYDDGGYDMFAIGFGGFNRLEPYSATTNLIDTDYLSPNGLNMAWYQNSVVDELIDSYFAATDDSLRKSYAQEIQQTLYDDVPYLPIVSLTKEVVTSSSISFNESIAYALQQRQLREKMKDLSLSPSNVIQYVTPNTYTNDSYLPFVNTVEGTYITNLVFSGLYDVEHNMTGNNFSYTPVLASDLPVWNADNTVAEIKINPNANFSNGNPVEPWDIVNTYRMHLTNVVDSSDRYYINEYLPSNNSIEVVNSTTVRFSMNQPYAFAESLFSLGIMDDEVIGNYTNPAESDYKFTRSPEEYWIGAGPYIFEDAVSDRVVLQARNGSSYLGADNYWNGEVQTDRINFFTESDKITALDIAAYGSVPTILEPKYSFKISDLSGYTGLNSYEIIDDSIQVLSINMEHPILGTGSETPLGIADPSRASEAASYVRKALSHLIPRSTIVDEIFFGNAVANSDTLWHQNAIDKVEFDGYTYNETLAKEYLEMAGYEFPVVTTLPEIGDVVISPTTGNINPDDIVTIQAEVFNTSTLSEVTLHLFINGAEQIYGMEPVNEGWWEASVGPFDGDTTVNYKISAVDENGNSVESNMYNFYVNPADGNGGSGDDTDTNDSTSDTNDTSPNLDLPFRFIPIVTGIITTALVARFNLRRKLEN